MYYGVTRILLPLEPQTTPVTVVPHALEVAEHYDAALHVLVIVTTTSTISREELYRAFDARNRTVAKTLIEQLGQQNVHTVAVSIAGGTPIDAIQQYATQHKIDLIIVGLRRPMDHKSIPDVSAVEDIARVATVPVHVLPLESCRENEENTGERLV